jgi:rare lipoprotein A
MGIVGFLAQKPKRTIVSQKMKRSVCAVVAACVALAGCGGKKRVQLPTAARLGSTETGVASWYGYPYHGRRAANGEIYDMEKMTAAHRTLPFGTWVRVKNLENNKTVDVQITDRGPFAKGRFLDLSHAAAVRLAMIGPGTAKVKLTVIRGPGGAGDSPVIVAKAGESPAAAHAQFAVQVGAFTDRRNAERVRSAMESRYGSAKVVMRDGKPAQWRVLVGREDTEEDAEALAGKIRADADRQVSSPFVVRLDNETGSDSL